MLGSQTPDNNFRMVANMQTMQLFDFEICGATSSPLVAGTDPPFCYMNKANFHDTHVDVKSGISWRTV